MRAGAGRRYFKGRGQQTDLLQGITATLDALTVSPVRPCQSGRSVAAKWSHKVWGCSIGILHCFGRTIFAWDSSKPLLSVHAHMLDSWVAAYKTIATVTITASFVLWKLMLV
jgi:hypothetical protein